MSYQGARHRHARRLADARSPSLATLAAVLVCGCIPSPSSQSNPRVLYYRDPMNPAVTSPVPRKDEMGMDYVPVYVDSKAASDGVQLSDATIHNLGVTTAPVGFGPLATEIRATGIVRTNEHSVREVRLRVEGWIEELSVRAAGDTVRAGQPLLKLYSPRMESAEQEFLTSLQFNDAARTALAERRLTDLGMELGFIQTLRESRKLPHQIPFHVPTAGVVTELGVRQGAYIETNTFVLRLATLDPAWITAEVPESAVGEVAVGGAAEVAASAFPGRSFKGRVDYIYPELDQTTRTLRVRLVVPNKDGALIPNMYVSATLAGAQSEAVVHVPRDAVIRDGDTTRVLLARDDNRFTPKSVRLGREVGDEIVILEGLSSGDRVVTSAVFLVDSEATLKASLARIDRGGRAPSEPSKP
jgi:membrane fusion protein, copper/silver efflux system